MTHRYNKRSDSATSSSTTNRLPVAATSDPTPSSVAHDDDVPNSVVYKKMEAIVERIQDPHNGIVVKTVKSFMSKIPSVFTAAFTSDRMKMAVQVLRFAYTILPLHGLRSDLISWMTKNLDIDDPTEALHLAHLMGAHGYIFPIDDHILTVKNDGAYYRFQTPCFWPSRCPEPENTDYAVYLCKRTMQNKQRLELVDYEAENLARLQKMFSRKVDKKRDKLERKVLDSQERAFWDVHRPAPGCVNTTEVDIKTTYRTRRQTGRLNGTGVKSLTGESGNNLLSTSTMSANELTKAANTLQAEIERLHRLAERRRIKVSKVAESYLSYFEQYLEFDPFITPSEPSNPWISDNTDYWEQESTTKDIPQRRVKRWSFSVRELLKDTAGREHFRGFLEKEFSAENLKFWEACRQLKFIPQKDVHKRVQEIYTEYLSAGARDPVNVDSKVADSVRRKVTESPDRYCFDEAVDHIYQLMKNDSYNRYLRSDMYKEFLSGTKKKSGKRSFATEVRRLRELSRAQASQHPVGAQASQHPVGAQVSQQPVGAQVPQQLVGAQASQHPVATQASQNPAGIQVSQNPVEAQASQHHTIIKLVSQNPAETQLSQRHKGNSNVIAVESHVQISQHSTRNAEQDLNPIVASNVDTDALLALAPQQTSQVGGFSLQNVQNSES